MELIDVVYKLTGPIHPIGSSEEDSRRFENLKVVIKLVDQLLFDINGVATCANNHQASMSKAGKQAQEFLIEVKETD